MKKGKGWHFKTVITLATCVGCGYRTQCRIVGHAHESVQSGESNEVLPDRDVEISLCVDCVAGIGKANEKRAAKLKRRRARSKQDREHAAIARVRR